MARIIYPRYSYEMSVGGISLKCRTSFQSVDEATKDAEDEAGRFRQFFDQSGNRLEPEYKIVEIGLKAA